MTNHLKRLKFLIERSNKLYEDYKIEPLYINALLIKNVNKEIIDFLLANGQYFDNVKDVNEIIDHFEIWYFQFLEHEKSINSIKEKFIFKRLDQATAYPKRAIDRLLKTEIR